MGSILHFIFGALVLSFKQPYFRQGFPLGLDFHFSDGAQSSCFALLVPGLVSARARYWALRRAGRSSGSRKGPSTAMTVISA